MTIVDLVVGKASTKPAFSSAIGCVELGGKSWTHGSSQPVAKPCAASVRFRAHRQVGLTCRHCFAERNLALASSAFKARLSKLFKVMS